MLLNSLNRDLAHPDFWRHSLGHSQGHFGPEGPEDSCRGPARVLKVFEGARKPFTNPPPTLRQPFANLSPALRQPCALSLSLSLSLSLCASLSLWGGKGFSGQPFLPTLCQPLLPSELSSSFSGPQAPV